MLESRRGYQALRERCALNEIGIDRDLERDRCRFPMHGAGKPAHATRAQRPVGFVAGQKERRHAAERWLMSDDERRL
jgi:hypothetical protein